VSAEIPGRLPAIGRRRARGRSSLLAIFGRRLRLPALRVHRPVRVRDLSNQPFYARLLRLRSIHPRGVLCALFFEGAFLVGGLVALAELASWWSLLVLPLTVAALVKTDDLITGWRADAARTAAPVASPSESPDWRSATGRPGSARGVARPIGRVTGRATVPGNRPVPAPRHTY